MPTAKLTKPWNAAPAGTEITADPAEAKDGAVLVDPARFAHLEAGGFFAAPELVEKHRDWDRAVEPGVQAARDAERLTAKDMAVTVTASEPKKKGAT
jgi:hypothetical protein